MVVRAFAERGIYLREAFLQITYVSADGADWISAVVTDRCPEAVQCGDLFHVVSWATDALDEVSRQAWNTARGAVTQGASTTLDRLRCQTMAAKARHRRGRLTGTNAAPQTKVPTAHPLPVLRAFHLPDGLGHRSSIRMRIGTRYAAATSAMINIVRQVAQDRPAG